MLSAEGVQADPARLAALATLPMPKTARELRQFLQSANWIRGNIPRFSAITGPLQTLLTVALEGRKKTNATAASVQLEAAGWNSEHERVWKELKQAIAAAVPVGHTRDDYDVHLFPDASNDHWGVLLTQTPPGADQSDKPVEDWGHTPLAFLSGTFRGAESRWSTTDKEGYAFKEGCVRLEHFLHRERGFTVHTDHRNLVYIFNPDGRPGGIPKATAGRLDRWAMRLADYNFKIRHVAGEENTWADLLSRWGAVAKPCVVTARRARLKIPNRLGAVIWTMCGMEHERMSRQRRSGQR